MLNLKLYQVILFTLVKLKGSGVSPAAIGGVVIFLKLQLR